MARVEVLRGPQGTLFGSGSLGGTVRIITNQPDATKFDATEQVDLAGTDGGGLRQRYDAMVNLPLVDDKLALRIVGYYRDEDGWVKNITLGTRNDSIDWGGRAALQWTPTDALKVRAEIFHQSSDPKDGDFYNPTLGKFRAASVISEGRPADITNYNLDIDYSFAKFATLTVSSTYQTTKSALREDIGPLLGAGTPDFVLNAPETSRFYVQEGRLVSNTPSRLQWVAGIFYINRSSATPNYELSAPGLDALFGGIPGSDTYFKTDITTKSTELAGYADGSYEILDGLKLRGGFRFFRTTAEYSELNRITLNFATLSYSAPASLDNKTNDTNSTWRYGISYEPSKSMLFYVNVSKGYRIGQVNPNFGPSAINPSDYVIPRGYQPDYTINYELGAKTSWLDNRVTLDLTAFYISWHNIQINGTRISDRLSFIANAGTADVHGLEAEFAAQPMQGLTLYANATAQDGQIDSVPTNIVIPTAKGDVLPGLARYKVAAGVERRWDVRGGNQAFIRLDGQYTSSSPNAFSDAGANSLFAIDEAYSTLDASVGLDTRWGTVALYGENLTNNDAAIVKYLSLPNSYTSLRPLTVGVRVTFRQ
ncbi:MAG TPA: TonB-dependent receptor [Caulobacteraceae bacterium]|nr:TonB-dependent receptor [Caulobacteraceae bacterium]